MKIQEFRHCAHSLCIMMMQEMVLVIHNYLLFFVLFCYFVCFFLVCFVLFFYCLFVYNVLLK